MANTLYVLYVQSTLSIYDDSQYPTAVLAIVLLIVTFAFALLVMNNFGRGLKEQSTSRSPFYDISF